MTLGEEDALDTNMAAIMYPIASCYENLRHASGKMLGPSFPSGLLYSVRQQKNLTIPFFFFPFWCFASFFLQFGGTKQQRKPVAQPFRLTQWTHRPIRLHLLTPATRATMSTFLSLSLLLSLFFSFFTFSFFLVIHLYIIMYYIYSIVLFFSSATSIKPNWHVIVLPFFVLVLRDREESFLLINSS